MTISRLPSLSIRSAELPDMDKCLTLDAAYSTDFVWQMDTCHNDGQVDVTFRAVRLPRSMQVKYPRNSRQLIKNWHACEGFLVAEQTPGQLVGYIALTTQEDQGIVSITDLVVESDHRQRGVGTALVRAAADWGKQHGLFRLMTELQTKNYPAICFYQKRGFVFCGFNDHYYANQDIALFFVQGLR